MWVALILRIVRIKLLEQNDVILVKFGQVLWRYIVLAIHDILCIYIYILRQCPKQEVTKGKQGPGRGPGHEEVER
jgi:hypothetical protein